MERVNEIVSASEIIYCRMIMDGD